MRGEDAAQAIALSIYPRRRDKEARALSARGAFYPPMRALTSYLHR